MSNFTFCEKMFHSIKINIIDPLMAKKRRKKLHCTDFTIISNNCWGGIVYDYFKIKKCSPTVGCFFFADDYIKFLKNLRHYLSTEIKMINLNQSKHFSEISSKDNYPVGKLDDLEIYFMHYKNPIIAKEKRERRCKRVNYNKLLIKFSYMNNCNDLLVKEFQELNFKNKICFVSKKYNDMHDLIQLDNNGKQIYNDTFYRQKR